MCKLITAVAVSDQKLLKQIIAINEANLLAEPDGFAYASDLGSIRSLNYKFEDVTFDRWIMLHTRTATAGAVNQGNTHCWSINGWTFAHNGWITGLYDKNKSDSLLFFENMLESDMSTNDILQRVQNSSLYGVASLINPSINRCYFIARSKALQIYAMPNNGGLVTSSFELDLAEDLTVSAYGLAFDNLGAQDDLISLHTTAYNQLLEVDLTTGSIVKIISIMTPPVYKSAPYVAPVVVPTRYDHDYTDYDSGA